MEHSTKSLAPRSWETQLLVSSTNQQQWVLQGIFGLETQHAVRELLFKRLSGPKPREEKLLWQDSQMHRSITCTATQSIVKIQNQHNHQIPRKLQNIIQKWRITPKWRSEVKKMVWRRDQAMETRLATSSNDTNRNKWIHNHQKSVGLVTKSLESGNLVGSREQTSLQWVIKTQWEDKRHQTSRRK